MPLIGPEEFVQSATSATQHSKAQRGSLQGNATQGSTAQQEVASSAGPRDDLESHPDQALQNFVSQGHQPAPLHSTNSNQRHILEQHSATTSVASDPQTVQQQQQRRADGNMHKPDSGEADVRHDAEGEEERLFAEGSVLARGGLRMTAKVGVAVCVCVCVEW